MSVHAGAPRRELRAVACAVLTSFAPVVPAAYSNLGIATWRPPSLSRPPGVHGLGAVGWARGWWSGIDARRYTALSVAIAILVAELGGWGLIGWGFG